VPMCRGCHPRSKDRFHVLGGVSRLSTYGKGTDLRNALPTGWTPSGDIDGKEPNFPERLHNGSTRAFRRFRIPASLIGVQVPIDRLPWQLSHRGIGNNPAADFFTIPLADRPADLCKGFRGGG